MADALTLKFPGTRPVSKKSKLKVREENFENYLATFPKNVGQNARGISEFYENPKKLLSAAVAAR